MTQAQLAVKWDLITFNFGLHDLSNSTHGTGLLMKGGPRGSHRTPSHPQVRTQGTLSGLTKTHRKPLLGPPDFGRGGTLG